MKKMTLSPNALRVLEARYLRRNEDRRVVETPAELFESVARGIAFAEHLLLLSDFLEENPCLILH